MSKLQLELFAVRLFTTTRNKDQQRVFVNSFAFRFNPPQIFPSSLMFGFHSVLFFDISLASQYLVSYLPQQCFLISGSTAVNISSSLLDASYQFKVCGET